MKRRNFRRLKRLSNNCGTIATGGQGKPSGFAATCGAVTANPARSPAFSSATGRGFKTQPQETTMSDFDITDKRAHMTATGRILRQSELILDGADAAERRQLKEAVDEALFEISYGLSGTALSAYNASNSIAAGDEVWVRSAALQEMQTVCLLSELLLLFLNYKQDIEDESAPPRVVINRCLSKH